MWGLRISATDLALITRQMATLVGSGLPVEEALGAVARQADRARLGGLMLAVRTRVLEGHTLATALGDFPQVFPELYRATVAAGEQSGHLEVVFERLADYTEARQQMRQKVGLALFYPLLLTTVAILVVAGLLTYVVPQVVQVFSSLNQQLPALTRGLIALSEFLRQNGWLLLAILAAGAVAWAFALRRIGFRRRVHQALLRMPLVARLIRGVPTPRASLELSAS
jgi:general secretion pathway protein F